jgi:hypothetical protein
MNDSEIYYPNDGVPIYFHTPKCQYCGTEVNGEVIRLHSAVTSQTMYVCVSCIIDLIGFTHELRDEKRGE